VQNLPAARERVESLLKESFESMVADEHGWFIVVNGVVVRVRVRQHEDPPPGATAVPTIWIETGLLQGVSKSPELLDALNELNAGVAMGRLYWSERVVMFSASMLAENVAAIELRLTIGLAAAIFAESSRLQDAFGGERPYG